MSFFARDASMYVRHFLKNGTTLSFLYMLVCNLSKYIDFLGEFSHFNICMGSADTQSCSISRLARRKPRWTHGGLGLSSSLQWKSIRLAFLGTVVSVAPDPRIFSPWGKTTVCVAKWAGPSGI